MFYMCLTDACKAALAFNHRLHVHVSWQHCSLGHDQHPMKKRVSSGLLFSCGDGKPRSQLLSAVGLRLRYCLCTNQPEPENNTRHCLYHSNIIAITGTQSSGKCLLRQRWNIYHLPGGEHLPETRVFIFILLPSPVSTAARVVVMTPPVAIALKKELLSSLSCKRSQQLRYGQNTLSMPSKKLTNIRHYSQRKVVSLNRRRTLPSFIIWTILREKSIN